jgi:hypothetical protein
MNFSTTKAWCSPDMATTAAATTTTNNNNNNVIIINDANNGNNSVPYKDDDSDEGAVQIFVCLWLCTGSESCIPFQNWCCSLRGDTAVVPKWTER